MTKGILQQLTLTLHQREVLKFIANHGGHCPFKFGVVVEDPKRTVEGNAEVARKSDDSVREMAERLRVISITPIIGKDEQELTLTDAGRQVLDQILKMETVPSLISTLEEV